MPTDSSNYHHWKTILNSYKSTEFNKRSLKFENFDGKGTEAEEIKKLQKICKDLFKELLTSDKNNYRKAAKWCVVPVNAKEILRRRGIKALDVQESDSKWERKIMLYKINKNRRKIATNLDEKLKKVNGIDREKISSLKEICKEFGGQFNYEKDSHHARDIFEAWCSAT